VLPVAASRTTSARAGAELERQALAEGVDVKPPEDALLEALTNGSVHPSLIEEPRAA
jgi:hypothetical protein